jgi:hypothetical protein
MPMEDGEVLAWQEAAQSFTSYTLPAQADLGPPGSETRVNMALSLPPNRSNLWSNLLPHGGSVVQHIRQPRAGGKDEVLGEPLLTGDGEHRFVFTVISGTGTGMRVGIASADGSQTFGMRLYDGRLAQHPPPPPKDDGEGGLPARLCSETDRVWDRIPGTRIEIIVDLTTRRLDFNVGESGGRTVDAGVQLPREGVRPWFQCQLKGDAVAISEHRVFVSPLRMVRSPSSPGGRRRSASAGRVRPSSARSPSPSASRSRGGAAYNALGAEELRGLELRGARARIAQLEVENSELRAKLHFFQQQVLSHENPETASSADATQTRAGVTSVHSAMPKPTPPVEIQSPLRPQASSLVPGSADSP